MAAVSSSLGGVRRPRSDSDSSSGSSAKKPRKQSLATRDLDSEKKRISITQCMKLAKAGNPQAQWRMGNAFYYGHGGKAVDVAQSIIYYTLAAEGGYPRAVHDMACFYADGQEGFIEVDKPKAVKLWTQAASAGCVEAMRCLAGAYDVGDGVDQDTDTAFKWFQLAVDAGDTVSTYMLAWYYDSGLAPSGDNPQRANELYAAAAAKGDTSSMHNLGRNLQHGRGVQAADDEKAVELYRQGAEAGGPKCMAALGWMLREGRGVAQDLQAATEWLTKASSLGDPDAKLTLATMLLSGDGGSRNPALATELATEALPAVEEEWVRDHGDGAADPAAPPEKVWVYDPSVRSSALSEAHFILGLATEHLGPGDPSVARTAFQHFLTAARHGHSASQHTVGTMLDLAVGMEKDTVTARQWYELAAAQDHAESMYALGVGCRAGRGTPKNDERAMKWYLAAAKLGHARAWNKVGWMRQLGIGQCDPASVLKAYTMAAGLGSTKAMCHMGALHRDGSLGLPVSKVEARKWFKKAADAGSELGQTQLSNMEEGVLPLVAAKAAGAVVVEVGE